jgi:hypothetical protein
MPLWKIFWMPLQWNCSMRCRVSNNRRVACCLMTLLFLLINGVSNAAWRCRDGNLCPPGCSMVHSSHIASKTSSQEHACCADSSAPRLSVSAPSRNSLSTSFNRATNNCLLQVQPHPDIIFTGQYQGFVPDLIALLPVSHEGTFSLSTIAVPCFSIRPPPPRQTRSFALLSPRAPPTLL